MTVKYVRVKRRRDDASESAIIVPVPKRTKSTPSAFSNLNLNDDTKNKQQDSDDLYVETNQDDKKNENINQDNLVYRLVEKSEESEKSEIVVNINNDATTTTTTDTDVDTASRSHSQQETNDNEQINPDPNPKTHNSSADAAINYALNGRTRHLKYAHKSFNYKSNDHFDVKQAGRVTNVVDISLRQKGEREGHILKKRLERMSKARYHLTSYDAQLNMYDIVREDVKDSKATQTSNIGLIKEASLAANNEYVYDYYMVDLDSKPSEVNDAARIESFDEELLFDDDMSEYSSDDSNAENYYMNDYPDEDDEGIVEFDQDLMDESSSGEYKGSCYRQQDIGW